MGNFAINQSTFLESLTYNSCLNKKVSIDVNGEIKQCPSMIKTFGNINKYDTISDALGNSTFTGLWNYSKDQIEICKDCEFRHICTDCRAFVKNINDKPFKCNYDPYTAKWKN